MPKTERAPKPEIPTRRRPNRTPEQQRHYEEVKARTEALQAITVPMPNTENGAFGGKPKATKGGK